MYIAGYITRNDSGSCEYRLLNETTFYYQKYGQYLDPIDWGGINIPTDNTCQWSIFYFILFNAVKEKVRRKCFVICVFLNGETTWDNTIENFIKKFSKGYKPTFRQKTCS